MSNNNKVIYDKQIRFDGNAYLDPKQMPVDSHADLLEIPQEQLFNGMKVVVNSDETFNGETTTYVYYNGWNLVSLTTEIITEE